VRAEGAGHEQRWHSQHCVLDGPGGGDVLDSDVWQLHLAGMLHAQQLNYVYGNVFVLTEKAWEYAEAAWKADSSTPWHEPTGWQAVDVSVTKLREMAHVAADPHDFKAVGHQCVTVLETLGRKIFRLQLSSSTGQGRACA